MPLFEDYTFFLAIWGCCLFSSLCCLVALTLRGWMNRVHWHNCHCLIQFTNYPSCADCVLFMLRVLSEPICVSKWVINIKCGSITWSIQHIQTINLVREAFFFHNANRIFGLFNSIRREVVPVFKNFFPVWITHKHVHIHTT